MGHFVVSNIKINYSPRALEYLKTINRYKSWGQTFLAPLLACVVNVVLELDADLPLVRLVSDERVFQELISGWPLGIILHQTVFDKVDELLRPVEGGKKNYSYY